MGGVAPIFLIPLRSKALIEGWDIVPMFQIPLGRQNFRRLGMATCAEKWKTANICKRKPLGGLQAENN